MMERQTGDPSHVAGPDFQEGDAVDRELMRKKLFERLGQLELTETMLDRDFPQACDARQNVVVGMLNDTAGLLTETGIS